MIAWMFVKPFIRRISVQPTIYANGRTVPLGKPLHSYYFKVGMWFFCLAKHNANKKYKIEYFGKIAHDCD